MILDCKYFEMVVEDVHGNQWEVTKSQVVPRIGEMVSLPYPNGNIEKRWVKAIEHAWKDGVQFIKVVVQNF